MPRLPARALRDEIASLSSFSYPDVDEYRKNSLARSRAGEMGSRLRYLHPPYVAAPCTCFRYTAKKYAVAPKHAVLRKRMNQITFVATDERSSRTQKMAIPKRMTRQAGTARNANGDNTTCTKMFDQRCVSETWYSGLSIKMIATPHAIIIRDE
jgi:hypothetical protein